MSKRIINELVIKLDTDNENPIFIGKNIIKDPETPAEVKEMVLLDIATLSEAIVMLIKSAHKMGIKDESTSLRHTIDYINKSFNDPSTIEKFS